MDAEAAFSDPGHSGLVEVVWVFVGDQHRRHPIELVTSPLWQGDEWIPALAAAEHLEPRQGSGFGEHRVDQDLVLAEFEDPGGIAGVVVTHRSQRSLPQNASRTSAEHPFASDPAAGTLSE